MVMPRHRLSAATLARFCQLSVYYVPLIHKIPTTATQGRAQSDTVVKTSGLPSRAENTHYITIQRVQSKANAGARAGRAPA
eukprot:2135008-Pleurochrysis_carterae.AAC.1